MSDPKNNLGIEYESIREYGGKHPTLSTRSYQRSVVLCCVVHVTVSASVDRAAGQMKALGAERLSKFGWYVTGLLYIEGRHSRGSRTDGYWVALSIIWVFSSRSCGLSCFLLATQA